MTESELRARNEDLQVSLEWALDLLDLYDEVLIELGEPKHKVLSPTHVAAKQKARMVCQGGRLS